MLSASPRLAELVRRHSADRKRAPRHLSDIPTSNAAAESLTKELKSQGYTYVDPTSVYAFLQNVGGINDHLHDCFRGSDHPS